MVALHEFCGLSLEEDGKCTKPDGQPHVPNDVAVQSPSRIRDPNGVTLHDVALQAGWDGRHSAPAELQQRKADYYQKLREGAAMRPPAGSGTAPIRASKQKSRSSSQLQLVAI